MKRSVVVTLLCSTLAVAQSPLYGQCGGEGYTGPTTCVSGAVCTYSNPWYSQCLPGSGGGNPTTQNPQPTTTQNPQPTSTGNPPTGTIPNTYKWSSSGVLISPKSDGRNVAGVKDPTIVQYNGAYHVFFSVAVSNGYNMAHTTFTDFNNAGSASFFYLDQSGIGTGYRAAPQVFYFAPQKLWYLVYQNGNAAYSTNPDISNPRGWTAPKTFYSGMPTIIKNNIGNGHWVDMWVICDSSLCHLFSSDDNGHLYRSQTSLSNYPNGFNEPVIAMQDANRNLLFEAANVYKISGSNSYLLLIEAIGSDGRRWFRSWTAPNIAGPWTGLANTESNPFARANNVAFSGTAWTKDISHGELIRDGYDQNLTINPCKMRFLYQGLNPNSGGDYNLLPYRLGLITQTNSAC